MSNAAPMSWELKIANLQRVRSVNTRLLRSILRWLLETPFQAGLVELCVHLVDGERMARVNEQFLGHAGSTDVITFDHLKLLHAGLAKGKARSQASLRAYCGEMFISVDDALHQATRFRSSWPSEVVRYVIHGLLHLSGHDDLEPEARRRMKREENRLLRLTATAFPIDKLAAVGRPAGRAKRRVTR
jgi:rRNA maturation RNase YbeY